MGPVCWVIIHDTEGDTARGAASWFANPESKGSAHLVVDNSECYRTLPDDYIPWGAVGANEKGLHIELAGHASWTSVIWKKAHREMLERAAHHVKNWCDRYDIPIRKLKAADLRAGKPGIAGHADVSEAFPGTGHYDPGANFPWRYFLRLVRNA